MAWQTGNKFLTTTWRHVIKRFILIAKFAATFHGLINCLYLQFAVNDNYAYHNSRLKENSVFSGLRLILQ